MPVFRACQGSEPCLLSPFIIVLLFCFGFLHKFLCNKILCANITNVRLREEQFQGGGAERIRPVENLVSRITDNK